jgi:hypothetical protein
VFRPVTRFSIGAVRPIVDALVDTGCEPVLADSSLALALIAGIDLSNPIDVERIGIAGGLVEAASLRSPAIFIHPLASTPNRSSGCLMLAASTPGDRSIRASLANVGFLDRFTTTVSRFAQATAVGPSDTLDARFGSLLAP